MFGESVRWAIMLRAIVQWAIILRGNCPEGANVHGGNFLPGQLFLEVIVWGANNPGAIIQGTIAKGAIIRRDDFPRVQLS